MIQNVIKSEKIKTVDNLYGSSMWPKATPATLENKPNLTQTSAPSLFAICSTMDKQLSPPLRIQVDSSTPVKPSSATTGLAAFLNDYQGRRRPEDNAVVRAQLQRLLKSLKDEEVQRKKGMP
jgi:hypothetical protein